MLLRTLETGTPHLLAEIRNSVAILTLNRPEVRNALGDSVSPMLREMIAQCDADPDVRVIVITGAGKAFCSGGDIKSMAAPDDSSNMTAQQRTEQLIERQRSLTGVLVKSRKPSIAVMPGPAAGAGLSIALACDLRIMANDTFVKTAFIDIGLPGDYGINWLLTRVVGSARARELMLLSERIDAERCEQMGLVTRVVEPRQLMPFAMEMAAQLAQRSERAIISIKDNLDDALEQDFTTSLDNEAVRMVHVAIAARKH